MYLEKISTLKSIVCIVLIFFVNSCATTSNISSRTEKADSIAKPNGFTKKIVKAGDFVFTVFERIKDKHLPLAVYIEKDGYAFTSTGISDNPTPIQQMLLKLAALDKNRNVLFVARPCQYTDFSLDPKCNTNEYWTNKRLSIEVVNSINQLIAMYNNGKPISLIGHSGGGALAVLVAANNIKGNIKDIITIAANLDLTSFNEFHKVPGSMNGSLNPIDFVNKVNYIPQLHLAGQLDSIVPSFVIKKYVDNSNPKCVRMRIIDDASHNDGWKNEWTNLLTQPNLTCDH